MFTSFFIRPNSSAFQRAGRFQHPTSSLVQKFDSLTGRSRVYHRHHFVDFVVQLEDV